MSEKETAWEWFKRELGATGVISESFKSLLFRIALAMQSEAFERGIKEANRRRKK
jgi:hypothetical protein